MNSLFLGLAMLFAIQVHGADWAQLGPLYKSKLAAAKVPALQVVFSQNGQPIYSDNIGFSDPLQQVPIQENTLFYSASMTKMLTAVTVFQLSERGLIHLDDKVVKYVPWLAMHSSPQASRITIAQLLSHTSGMSRNGVEFWSDPSRWEDGSVPTESELQRAVLQQTFGVLEGTRLKYSNLGYELLGYLIGGICDRCQGRSRTERYMNYVTRNILIPLKMDRSGFVPTAELKQAFATPFGAASNQGVRPAYPVLAGAGASAAAWGLFSTAKDFSSFMYEIKKAAFNEKNSLLKKDFSFSITHPVAWDLLNPGVGHSLGFRIIKTNQGLLVGHTGSFPGYSSAAFVSLSNGSVGVVYLNTVDAGGLGYLIEAFKTQSGQVLASESPQLPNQLEAPAMPGNPFSQIVGKYRLVYGAIEVIYENDRYFLVQSGQKIPLYIAQTPDGTSIEGRLGTNSGYLDWVGDSVKFNLDAKGAVLNLLVANSILIFPVAP